MTDERLEVERISKMFGDTVTLRDLSFDVRAGELFGFVGSNGAGKTTAMRQEDVAGPAMMLIIIPYIAGISILPHSPGNTVLAATSLIPLFSPVLTPMLIALGTAPVWQLILSVGLTALTIVGLVWLAGRVYSNAVLRTGSRVTFRDALRAVG